MNTSDIYREVNQHQFENTSIIKIQCHKICPLEKKSDFELSSSSVYVVLNEETDSAKVKQFCKIPFIKNGFVVNLRLNKTLLSSKEVPDETAVKVVCKDGYYLNLFKKYQPITCKTWDWDRNFPKCTSNI